MVEVGSCQNNPGLPHASRFFDVGPMGRAAGVIAAGLTGLVVPPSIRQNANDFAMRAPAALTDAAGALEPHMITELRPVDWIKPAHLCLDRHSPPLALVACSPRPGSSPADKLHPL